jgi:very-short-patch-repair endonuclease
MPKFAKTSVSNHMRSRASNLRNQSTPAEILLWQELKNSKLGVKFRRQQPLDHFIVDFYCADLNLVIEIDGNTHDFLAVATNDAHKENYLRNQGYHILRFTDHDVQQNLDGVITNISEYLLTHKSPPQTC